MIYIIFDLLSELVRRWWNQLRNKPKKVRLPLGAPLSGPVEARPTGGTVTVYCGASKRVLPYDAGVEDYAKAFDEVSEEAGAKKTSEWRQAGETEDGFPLYLRVIR
jgi:hypothetical protein